MANRNSDPSESDYGSQRIDAIQAFEKAVAAEAAAKGVDQRLDKFDQRFDKLESQISDMKKEFHDFSTRFATFSTGVEKDDTSQISLVAANQKRIDALEGRQGKSETKVAIIFAIAAIFHPLLIMVAGAWIVSQIPTASAP